MRKVKSADRTLDLLEALANAGCILKSSEIATTLDIPKSSLFHLLGTLEERGYVIQSEPGLYCLGPSVTRLAQGRDAMSRIKPIIERLLDELCDTVNESCSFYIERDDHVEVVVTRTGRQALTYTMQIGDRAPHYAVSAGKALLAQKDDAWLEAYIQRVRFERFTPKTIHSRARLLREIEQVRKEGMGFVNEEFTPGIIGFGAVLRQSGKTLGAINIALPSPRFTEAKASQVRHHLAVAVARAENQLG